MAVAMLPTAVATLPNAVHHSASVTLLSFGFQPSSSLFYPSTYGRPSALDAAISSLIPMLWAERDFGPYK